MPAKIVGSYTDAKRKNKEFSETYLNLGLREPCTSLILIRTDKGMKEFETISSKLKLKEVAYEDGVRSNSAEYKSCRRPSQRDTFFEDMDAMEFEELEKKYASPIKVTFKSRVKRKIKNTIKSALRAIGGAESK